MESTISHAYTETMIELRLWQILAVFAQEGTLSASAKRLHISQPALSQALVRLEKELGVSLCERSSHNRISLNERGKEAAKKAQALLDQATALETELRAASALNIGICAPVPADLLREPLEQTFHQQARFVMEESPDSLLLRLQSGQYRLIVSCRPETETALYCRKREEESLSLAIPKNHPLASRKIIRDEDLVGQVFCSTAGLAGGTRSSKTACPELTFCPSTAKQPFPMLHRWALFLSLSPTISSMTFQLPNLNSLSSVRQKT